VRFFVRRFSQQGLTFVIDHQLLGQRRRVASGSEVSPDDQLDLLAGHRVAVLGHV
jgi:hypothetical protein